MMIRHYEHRERTVKEAKVVELLAKSPAVQKALAEDAAAVLEHRKQLSSDMAALDRKMGKAYPSLEAAVADALATVKEAEKALKAANVRLGQASTAKMNASFRYQTDRDAIEHELRGSSSHLLAEFISEMRDAMQEARKSFYVDREVVHRNPITGKVRRTQASNVTEVNARVAAINAAIETAQHMQLDPSQTEVAAKIARIKSGLPTVTPATTPDSEEGN
jgi:hypothetical protein